MKPSISLDVQNLEQEYLRVKQILYKNLFRYCVIITLIIVAKEIYRAFVFGRTGIFIMLSVFLCFGCITFYFIWKLKSNQEVSITIFCTLFYLCALLGQYFTKSGYFDRPMDSFNFGFMYAVCERIVAARMSKFSHRSAFLLVTTTVRVFCIPADEKGLSFMQFVYLGFSVYLDMDKEKYDKNFFLMYFKNKEQLVKFKNLVVQDIPESIMIITQDLMKPLFVNNSFEELVKDDSHLDFRAKLQHFSVQGDSEKLSDKGTSHSSISSISRQTLLELLESTIHERDRFAPSQKFSCNLKYRKLVRADEEHHARRYETNLFEVKIIHLLWDDQPAIAVILHDITQQHTILSLKMADANKDAILATVSHELRTPLNGILGMIQIMQKKVRDSEMMNYLSICKNSGDLLLSLVNSILDLNQIRANKLKLNISRVSLNELLENIASLFRLQCNQKGLYLNLNISRSCPKYLITDKNRLSQIFINLVGNALKFTKNGGITISVDASPDQEHLIFAVEDTGSGIKDEDKNKLFQVFGKLQQSDTSVNPHGVGLGLTISDKLARILSNAGSQEEEGIQLESQYGKGSKFVFLVSKVLVEGSDSEVESSVTSPNLPKRLVDEKGGVFNKMLNYTQDFVKTSQTFVTQQNYSSLQTMQTIPRFNTVEIFNTTPTAATMRNANTSFTLARNELVRNVTPYVLIVDDNAFNTTIAECLVSAHGYKAKTALYGQTAIDMVVNCNYATEPIKLILMDCQMPGMDGYTATKILKKMMAEKKVPEIPIVALTANDSEADKAASRRAGMCDHLTKPLKEGELVKVLEKYMI